MVAYVSRQEYLEDIFDYRPGEHLNIITATGGGKSFIKYQLLGQALKQNPELGYLGCMPKASDATTVDGAERFGFRINDRYPFKTRMPWQPKPNGEILWPGHIRGDEQANREHLHGVFEQALADAYYRGNSLRFELVQRPPAALALILRSVIADAIAVGTRLPFSQFLLQFSLEISGNGVL